MLKLSWEKENRHIHQVNLKVLLRVSISWHTVSLRSAHRRFIRFVPLSIRGLRDISRKSTHPTCIHVHAIIYMILILFL